MFESIVAQIVAAFRVSEGQRMIDFRTRSMTDNVFIPLSS